MRADTESLPPTPPGSHYHISPSNREYEDVSRWLTANQGDPALQVRFHTIVTMVPIHREDLGLLATSEGAPIITHLGPQFQW